MIAKEFEAFLKAKRQAQDDIAAIDWGKKKQEWLSHLRKLHKTFEDALAEYRKKGEIESELVDVDIDEEGIGAYKAPMMVISFGGETIKLRPIGMNVIAAEGRVDMEGLRGSATLVLVSSALKRPGAAVTLEILIDSEPQPKKRSVKEGRLEWRFVTGPPYREFLPVTNETILRMLMKVSNGE